MSERSHPNFLILDELRKITRLLETLTALEEERRQSELKLSRFLDEVREQAEPELDESLMRRFFLYQDGRTYGIREVDGFPRPATPEETAFIQARIQPAKRSF